MIFDGGMIFDGVERGFFANQETGQLSSVLHPVLTLLAIANRRASTQQKMPYSIFAEFQPALWVLSGYRNGSYLIPLT
jgi:hypothetical protein